MTAQQSEIDYRRIETAISFIAQHLHDQPSLEDIAAVVHVSPFHFQRMFLREAELIDRLAGRRLTKTLYRVNARFLQPDSRFRVRSIRTFARRRAASAFAGDLSRGVRVFVDTPCALLPGTASDRQLTEQHLQVSSARAGDAGNLGSCGVARLHRRGPWRRRSCSRVDRLWSTV